MSTQHGHQALGFSNTPSYLLSRFHGAQKKSVIPYRYPIKGLSPERLEAKQLLSNEGFPTDRRYVRLLSNADFDPSAPIWLAKANFILLMIYEQIS